jgi:predicted  nucleic acid-binding Zn-ribbon protein
MENDEILKRLEFQDAERRKDKQTINDLLAQVATLQETINAQKREITHLSVENKKSATLYVRVEEYEEALAKLKAELVKPAADLDKKIALLEKEIESQRAEDMSVINRRLLELQNEIKPINELKNDIQTKLGDDFHLSQRIEELAKQFPELRQKDEELLRAIKLSDDHDRIEAKRVSDLAIELTTIRKKIDDEKIASDSQKEYLKKLEALINDLQNREQQRIQEQIAFIETQSRQTIDREGFIKDWQEKKDQLQALSASLQAQMLDLQGLNRTIKEAQAEFDELNQRLERRLKEIS